MAASEYFRMTQALSEQPLTLVHNDLAPKNVIASRASTPARIAFVDWEMAGVGCGLLDLVHLKHGLKKDAEKEMYRVYFSEIARSRGVSCGIDPMRALAACEVHTTIHRLAFAKRWNVKPEVVAKWVTEVQGYFDLL